jgi:hypothetical protein
MIINGKVVEAETKKCFSVIRANKAGLIRNDRMEDKDWLVVPMIMILEGVHEGSGGALYYPKEELSKTPEVWNHKPVVVYHPQKNGSPISACNPDVLTNRKVGIIMNTRFEDGKLKAEAWLDPQRISKVDDRIQSFLDKNEIMEVSTGLWTDHINEQGEWNGEKYDSIAINYRPDHLALLPDIKGACSVDDGAGFMRLNQQLQNEKSHHEIFRMLDDEIKKQNEDAWIDSIYDDYFIWEKDGSYFKQNYEVKDDEIMIIGLPIQVEKILEYKTLSRKESEMDKNIVIDTIVNNSNTKYTEKDREILEKMTDEQLLEALTAKEEKKEKVEINQKKEEKKEKVEINQKKEEAVENKTPMSAEEYLKSTDIPQSIKEVLNSGLHTYNSQKNAAVDLILSDSRNSFTENELRAKDLEELNKLAAFISKQNDQQKSKTRFFPEVNSEINNGAQPRSLVMPKSE